VLKGFKDFLLRGNVVDLAVAVVIGAAFTAVVTAFTNAFLKPLIQVFSGGGEFAGTFTVNGVVFDYASFVNAVITFVITAAVIYVLVVLPLKYVEERRRRGEEEGPADPTDVELLTEIRDLLRDQAARSVGTDRGDGATGGRIPHQDR
jgi:large conductance mechanosensitive channel